MTLGDLSHGSGVNTGKPSNFPPHFLKSLPKTSPVLGSPKLALCGHLSGLN